RLARDVYAMNLLAHSRRRIRCVVGRRDGDGNPLKPSRLLLATDDDALVRRAQAFFTFAGTSRPRPWLTPTAPADVPLGFQVPGPRDIQDLRLVNVTMFRDYLACPYRFYLKHVLRLVSVCDDLEELGGDQFGSLAHQVLQTFGESDLRDSDDSYEIAEYLSAVLDAQPQVADLDAKLPTVRIQLESLRRRLKQFALVQAERRQQGWRIVAVEQKLDVPWTVDGEPFVIRGRIDRIDQHDDGRWAVWDYKSSERAKSPAAAHRRRHEWIDLQLPLYRHLLTVWRPDVEPHRDAIVTGYISIPSLLRHITFDAAEWTPDELHEADAVAESVLRDLKANRFWPPNPQPPDFSDDFAAICQDHIFGREATV
ncbi:MAG TPA: PD-(D/E)XK nuclease family protein, partial [Pirellulaceae bacterium]|nr:PD-(D/E)XK nuclease family protein [Pirellulaceae bacterium]